MLAFVSGKAAQRRKGRQACRGRYSCSLCRADPCSGKGYTVREGGHKARPEKVYIMPYITTKALVLREVKFKEADKLLTVLTQDEGKLTVRARGALRKSCKYSASAQLLTFSEMTLFGNKGRWSINEANTLETFDGLRQDLGLLALGSYFAQLLETLSDEDSPNPAVLSLGLNALYALSNGYYTPEHIKAAFELRLMALSGYAPMAEGCGVCGAVDIIHPVLSVEEGFVQCRGCISGGGLRQELCEGSLAAMRHILTAESKKVFSFALSDDAAAMRLYRACEAYTRAQLDCGFSALDYWKTVRYAKCPPSQPVQG